MKRFGDGAPMERLRQIRQMAYRDLDETLCNILSDTLDYLQAKGSKVDPMTRTTYEYYKKQH